MNASEYKLFHEAYMQNNHGSTALHTFFTIFFTVQCTMLCSIRKKINVVPQILYEYVIIVLTMIVAHTLLSEYIFTLNLILFIFLLLEIKKIYNQINFYQTFMINSLYNPKRIHTITCLRSLTYLITAFCILAVDFKNFPRNLAKTERYGYSLMDTGVGLFVLMSGLVHKDFSRTRFITILSSNTKFIVTLVILGFVRFVTIKQLDYHEHVTEYGVHWNFFFTLAVCKVLSTFILSLHSNALVLCICTLIMHEYLLYCALQNWVYNEFGRLNLLDANKEGISSCLGYVSLYIFAVHLRNIITQEYVNKYVILKKLVMYSIMLVFCTYFINIYRPTSRTLANAGYCTYLFTILTITLSVMLPIEIIFRKKKFHFKLPLILHVINCNGLLYFLSCNITTGLINMIFRTLLMSSWSTFIILNCYMIFNIALFLVQKND